MAYFYYWDMPLNGPDAPFNAAYTPRITGPDANLRAFLAAARPRYPQMSNYSFDYGNTHWTVLDANPYVDWTVPPLRTWLERDLAGAQQATWRFVAFHQPGLGASLRPNDPKMQQIMSILQKGHVDVVFNGHIHTYAASRPLRFDGTWQPDMMYDGVKHTRANGILFVVSGAGGAHLHKLNDPANARQMLYLQLIARKFVPETFCFTDASVNGRTATFRQIDADGKELDRYALTK